MYISPRLKILVCHIKKDHSPHLLYMFDSALTICCKWDLLEKVSSASGMSQSRQSSMKQMQTLSAFTSTPDSGAEWLLEPESALAVGWPARFSAFSSSHVAAWSSWPEGCIHLYLYRLSLKKKKRSRLLTEFCCLETRYVKNVHLYSVTRLFCSPLFWSQGLVNGSAGLL